MDGEARRTAPGDDRAPASRPDVAPAAVPAAAAERPPRRGRRRLRIAIGAVVVLLAALGWWLHARNYEDTDDAQIDGNIGAVSARVPGTAIAVRVVENQRVRAGDVLVVLDPTDLEVALAQARAAVAQARAAVAVETPSVPITETSSRAAVDAADAEVESARTDLEAAQRDLDSAEASERLARSDLERARALVAGNSMAPADYDRRLAAHDVEAAATAAARKRLAGRRAKLQSALARQQEARQNAPRQVVTREASVEVRRANLELAEAQLRQARLNLGYAQVTAPADGIVGRKTVNVGDHVEPGQQLMALTQAGDLWVTANFRETQIELMRAGQPVEVHVDALSRDYRGVVESFAGATGSRYALLPPENASGNYVKVVQRVPVRIRLEPGQPEMDRLRPGMSVVPSVRIR
ncbi:HlyD family secretion protein [Anaeromyxobacter oryzisoli]|uniref:HlyD family secretion protein n=1 Tax=Anaeromyxobacter oryzisoli TaxID=2925408 RepID=UPI001F599ABC|nr:HlyD family secretion protein [Anaeromyxobacter sp. SG63]